MQACPTAGHGKLTRSSAMKLSKAVTAAPLCQPPRAAACACNQDQARLSRGRGVLAQAAGRHQRLGVGQVGVRVAAAKVLLGVAVHQARWVRAQLLHSPSVSHTESAYLQSSVSPVLGHGLRTRSAICCHVRLGLRFLRHGDSALPSSMASSTSTFLACPLIQFCGVWEYGLKDAVYRCG